MATIVAPAPADEPEPEPKPADCNEADKDALRYILSFFRPGQLVTMSSALRELDKTKYGDLHLVIVDGKIQTFKATLSFK